MTTFRPSPTTDERQELEPGKFAVSLPGLVRMKLMANRDKDRVHLRDMIDVGLIDRSMLAGLPARQWRSTGVVNCAAQWKWL